MGQALDYEAMWDRLETIELMGRRLPCLAVEDRLHMLCIHGAKHMWYRLQWILDVTGLVCRQAGAIDWNALLARGRAGGSERMILTALHLVRHLAGSAIPPALRERLQRDPRAADLAREVLERLGADPEAPLGQRRLLAFHLAVRERWRDRVRYLILLTFQPSYSDWTSLRLPRPLYGLYYLTRPFRLLWKALRRDWRTA